MSAHKTADHEAWCRGCGKPLTSRKARKRAASAIGADWR